MGSVFMYDHITGRRKVLTASEMVAEKRLGERRRDVRSAIRGEQLRLFRSDRTTEPAGGDGGASGGSAAVFEFLLAKLEELDADDLEHLVKVATDAQGVLQPDRLDPAALKRFRGEKVPRIRPVSPGGVVESYWPSERTEKATEKWVENRKIRRVQDNLINGVRPKERDIKAVRARGVGGGGEGGGGGWDLAEMKRRGRGIRGLDPGPTLPPASMLRLYDSMESHELLITVEYCHHCSWHNFSLRHDPKQYSDQADKILAYMVQLCHRDGVCAKVGVGRFMSR
jgi:hypothetical protein